jgi:hypothetical protein
VGVIARRPEFNILWQKLTQFKPDEDMMHGITVIIYTDKLDAVRDFYRTHFLPFPNAIESADSFTLRPNSEGQITWLDAGTHGQAPTAGASVRIHMPYTEIQRAHYVAAGVACSDLQEADWGAVHGNARYFTITDPAGVQLVFFEDHYGEKGQLMTTGDGRGTKEVQHEG